METFDFILNPLLLDITLPNTCNKDTFDYKYRNDAISIGLIFRLNLSQLFTSRLLEHLNKYESKNFNMNLLKAYFITFEDYCPFNVSLKQ